jgi:Carbohydrate-selective porin, OprB family
LTNITLQLKNTIGLYGSVRMVKAFQDLKLSLVILLNLFFHFSKVDAGKVHLSQNRPEQPFNQMQLQPDLEELALQTHTLHSSYQSNSLGMKQGKTSFSQQPNFVTSIENDAKCQLSCANEITSVSELSDIRPTDWVYTALQSLLDRYNLPADEKFDGNRSLTRYEFATVVSAAIDSMNKQIALNPEKLTQEDLKVLQRLQTEFATEIGNLQRRVELLEQRLPEEINQFSTTTKLSGEVLFAVSGVGNGTDVNDEDNNDNDNNITFGSRIRLNFNTSFTGKDNLRVRLQSTNLPRLDRVTGTDMARLAFQGRDDNQVRLNGLDYSFLISKDVRVIIPVVNGDLADFTDSLNPYLSGSSRGAISRFAQRNPIYRQGGGSGLGLSYEISDAVEFEVGFVAEDVDEPEVGFNKADYGAIAQLTLEPAQDIEFGLTYIHSYNSVSTGTGSERANDPFDDKSEAIVANSFGLQSTIKLNPNITVGGWVGYTQARATDLPGNPTASIFNWALTIALPDLGSQGSVAGFAIGQPPKVTSNDFTVANSQYQDSDTSLHFEAFYRLQALKNVGVTFGVLMITNPEHNSNNDSIYVGTVRATFRF